MSASGTLELDDSISVLSGIGEKRLLQYEKLNIRTIEDLIFYAPREYLDYSEVKDISDLTPGKMTIKARVAAPAHTWRKGRRQMTTVVFEDETGQVKATWFNQPYRANQLEVGKEFMVSGTYDFQVGSYNFTQPSVERIESERLSTGVIVAKYPETKGLNSRTIRKAQKEALQQLGDDVDIYPKKFIEDQELIGLKQALMNLHFPKSNENNQAATERLSFDELFALQLANRLTKDELTKAKSNSVPLDERAARSFVTSLPFKLTDSQRLASWEILNDIKKPHPMNRLLEGEVGSGKTVVAALAIFMTAQAGLLSVVLAPTTILATQHHKTLQNLLGPHKLKVEILSRHTPAAERKRILKAVKEGKVDCLVGTHSILSQGVEYTNLGLAIIDEQHRFGVEQRAKLRDKTGDLLPHVLTMTATPIPRSLALTLYGELAISIIKELPGGRKPIETKIFGWAAKSSAYKDLVTELAKGNQAYIVAPRIEDTDENMASIGKLEKELARTYLKDVKHAVLHAKLKADEKEATMECFYKGDIQVVISTSVVEVGLDNPNATMMLVESAERFGLAQLHQLRGRVGRGNKESLCYLVASRDIEPSRRLHAMAQTNDGFKLSELDLKIRGAGALYGTRQHGPLDINLADITDRKLIAVVSGAVDNYIKNGYDTSKFPLLNRRVAAMTRATFLN